MGKEISTFDKLFEMKVRYFENTAQFVQKLKLTGGAYQLEGYLEYGACNVKIVCRPHKCLSNSLVRQKGLQKKLSLLG